MKRIIVILFCLIFFTSTSQAQTYDVKIDYSKTVEEMITMGHFDFSSPDISSENFPTAKSSTADVTIELVQFNRDMESTEDVLFDLDLMGYRPATLPELLAFAATYPDKQTEFPIVALGSVLPNWRPVLPDGHKDKVVPWLWKNDTGRGTSLRSWGDGYVANYRFAAVRK